MTGHKITNTNKNNIHIHIGDKGKKRRKHRKSKRAIYPQQAYTSSHPALPLFNRPQSLDTTLGDDRERVRKNPLAAIFGNQMPPPIKQEAFENPVPAPAPKSNFSTQTPAEIKKEFKNAAANTDYEANDSSSQTTSNDVAKDSSSQTSKNVGKHSSSQTPAEIKKEFKNAAANTVANEAKDSSSQTYEQMESVREGRWRRIHERAMEDMKRMQRQREAGMQTETHPATSIHTQTFANEHHHIDTQTPSNEYHNSHTQTPYTQASHATAQTDFEDHIPPPSNSAVFREESGTNTGPVIQHRPGPFTSAPPPQQRIGPFTSLIPAPAVPERRRGASPPSDTSDHSPNKTPKSHREFDITHALRTKKNPPK